MPLGMSSVVHISTRCPPGYTASDSKSLSRSGIANRAARSPCTSIGYCRTLSVTQAESLRCTPKKTLICRASSSGQRRNPDFPRQKKQSFSQSRNRKNEERYNFENLEEAEPLSSRNGSLLSVYDTPKFQATAAPGPKEKEVVELFRKVQAQLRECAAIKEEKKIDALQGKGKENETVDSLLKLLRKHSVEQGKRSHTSAGSGDFTNNHSEPNGRRLNGDRGTNLLSSASPAKEELKPHNASTSPRRPVSNFQKKSPVPQMKSQPARPTAAISGPLVKNEVKIETRPDDLDDLDQEFDQEPEPEPEIASFLSKMTILHEPESSDDENIESEIEEEAVEDIDFTSLKLTELRALAKARGLKGFSKIKKAELVQLLSRDPT